MEFRGTAVYGLHPDYLRTLSDLKSLIWVLREKNKLFLKKELFAAPFFILRPIHVMTSEEEISTIVENILEVITSKGGQILGSQLGASMKSPLQRVYALDCESSALNKFKADYGGFARFIATHCETKIQVTGKSGLDDIYTIAERSESEHQTNQELYLRSNIDSAAIFRSRSWRVFTNPNSPQRLLFNKEKLEVKISQKTKIGEPSQGYKLFETLSVDDHREIIRDFIRKNTHSTDHRFLYLSFIDSVDYWSQWRDFLSKDNALSVRWREFRRERILNKLFSRVIRLGLSNQDSLGLLLNFCNTTIEEPVNHDAEFREALISVIREMDIEDARELPIPAKYLLRKRTNG